MTDTDPTPEPVEDDPAPEPQRSTTAHAGVAAGTATAPGGD